MDLVFFECGTLLRGRRAHRGNSFTKRAKPALRNLETRHFLRNSDTLELIISGEGDFASALSFSLSKKFDDGKVRVL